MVSAPALGGPGNAAAAFENETDIDPGREVAAFSANRSADESA
ncbi:hypothetical protein [Haloarcula sediminis]|nr:hypothetical protein [Haloarcula sp. CK38]